jgi:hypothetical protein
MDLKHHTSHPTLDILYVQALRAVDDLWTGADVADMLGSEYLRGQVELIANLFGSADGNDPRENIEMDIVATVCGMLD